MASRYAKHISSPAGTTSLDVPQSFQQSSPKAPAAPAPAPAKVPA